MSSVLGELSSCIPPEPIETCSEQHGCEIRSIVSDYHKLNDAASQRLETEDEKLVESILRRCNCIETEMRGLVEDGKLFEVPSYKRQAFGASCLVKVSSLFRHRRELGKLDHSI